MALLHARMPVRPCRTQGTEEWDGDGVPSKSKDDQSVKICGVTFQPMTCGTAIVTPAMYIGGGAAMLTVAVVLAAVLTLPESVTCRDSATSYFVKRVADPVITSITPSLACAYVRRPCLAAAPSNARHPGPHSRVRIHHL